MADTATKDDKQPTEEQVKEANAREDAKWQGDFKEEDLTIPYKREEEDDAGKDDTKAGDDTSGEGGESDDENNSEDEEVYSEPAPVITVEDPGEYRAPDVAFEVTLKDGKTVKVNTPDEAKKIADDPDNFDKPAQLLDFINKANSMQNKLEKSKDKWQDQKDAFEEQSKIATEREEIVENFASEFDYLVRKKLLPPIAKEFKDADWSDPHVAKQSGVKEQIALLNYMTKENTARARAGVKPITSIVDAHNAWLLDKNRGDAEQATKQAGEARKAAGAKVAGVSASDQAPYIPKGIAVGNPNVFKRGQAAWDN